MNQPSCIKYISWNFKIPRFLKIGTVRALKGVLAIVLITRFYKIQDGEGYSLRKQPTIADATTGFPAKWRLRNERGNTILMTRHYPDLGSASDWLGNLIQPIRCTTQIWVVTRPQYGISGFVSQTSFGGETSGSVAKCRLFSQANKVSSVTRYPNKVAVNKRG